MALTKAQRALLAQVMATPEWKSASPRERKALVEAGIVESGLRNLSYGDRDSLGFLQQRPSQGWKNPTNIRQATRNFLARARASNTDRGSAGELAQRVQRSAFPERYQQQSATADSILKRLGGKSSTPTRRERSVPAAPSSTATNARLAALAAYTQNPHLPTASTDLALGLLAARTPPSPVRPATPKSSPSPRVTGAKAGAPVLRETGVGGRHETAGLAGYPARDYFAPAGSAAVAPVSGKVVRLSGHDPKAGPVQGAGGPLGWSVYIKGDDGREYYLTHLGSRNVKPGQRVRQGQRIGTVANYHSYGRPDHIHMGVRG